MSTVDETPEANAIATIVADRCHGNRKPNQARERYATIWQAARLGAIEATRTNDQAKDEEIARLREALERLRKTAALLQQNAVGCAVEHYGQGEVLPGWLDDTANDIEAAAKALGASNG